MRSRRITAWRHSTRSRLPYLWNRVPQHRFRTTLLHTVRFATCDFSFSIPKPKYGSQFHSPGRSNICIVAGIWATRQLVPGGWISSFQLALRSPPLAEQTSVGWSARYRLDATQHRASAANTRSRYAVLMATATLRHFGGNWRKMKVIFRLTVTGH
jgi:hypothetical protein